MRLERLNNLPLNIVTPNFVAIFVFFGTASSSSFIERISFSVIEAKREAILSLFGCLEVNTTWIITSGASQSARANTIHLYNAQGPINEQLAMKRSLEGNSV